MADTVTTRWVYPPDWDGYYPDNSKGHRRYMVNLSCISDGTGETDVRKVVLADFLNEKGETGTRFVIEKIDCVGSGFAYVVLEFDRTPDETIAVLGETVSIDFTGIGGLVDNGDGGTGDILLTSSGASSGDSYNIGIQFRVK